MDWTRYYPALSAMVPGVLCVAPAPGAVGLSVPTVRDVPRNAVRHAVGVAILPTGQRKRSGHFSRNRQITWRVRSLKRWLMYSKGFDNREFQSPTRLIRTRPVRGRQFLARIV